MTVVVYRKQINEAGKKVNRWLNDALPGNPFGGGLGIEIPFTVGNLSKLVLARAAMARLRGEDDARVVVLDRIIARLREIEKERKAKLTVETNYVVKVTGDRIPGDLPSPSGTAGEVGQAAEDRGGDGGSGQRRHREGHPASRPRRRPDSTASCATRRRGAAHLRDLIRGDPTNLKLQQRLSAELQKQFGLREQIGDEERAVCGERTRGGAAGQGGQTLSVRPTARAAEKMLRASEPRHREDCSRLWV